MKIFSKVNEYNTLLEKILENKYFSSNVKNLLLSMIYKIENSYSDYYSVKKIRKSKEEFILEIIETIRDYANYIKIAEPNSEDAKILEKNLTLALTNEKNGNILTYPTEMAMLYAISDLKPKYFYINNDFAFKNGIQNMLVFGYNKNNLEVLTDFNGWSWNTDNKYNNYIYNLIYQNLLMIFGVKFLDQWMNYNSSKIDFIENIIQKTKDTQYFFWICRVIYLLEKNNDSFMKKINAKVKEFKEISSKEKYLEYVKSNKLKLTKAVEKIDIILNDENVLIKEFNKKNKTLDDNKKIKNIKHFKQILEKDRTQFVEKIKQMSNLLIPKNYLKLKEKLELYNRVVIEEKGLEDSVIELQKEFIKLLRHRVNKATINDSLIDIIYQIRYYKNIFISEGVMVKDNNILNSEIESLEKKVITLSCKNAILRIFSMDINLNFEIIKNILNTKIIELEQIKVKFDYEKENIKVEVYDKEIFEKQFNIKYSGKKQDLEIRKNKLVSLFI
ncbi:MAG: hypothetical protein ACI4UE_01780 [Candidatus Scatovivens sp.]